MTPNIGKLLPTDELLSHQIVETFATVAESDLSWTEKIWVSIPRKDGSLQIDFGLGRYQNRNVMDGFAGISRGNEQWTVRARRGPDGDRGRPAELRGHRSARTRSLSSRRERRHPAQLRRDVRAAAASIL